MNGESEMNKFKGNIIKIILAMTLFSLSGLVSAGEVNTGYFGNVAIKGYDPVAYFTEDRAVKGSENFSHTWLGADWNFSSEKHKKLFSENPVQYAPQYGGHCSDGISYGVTTTNIDPEAWRIIDGKLYLNYDQGAAVEIEEIDGQIAKAEDNWPEIRERLLAGPD
jgi:YHS domain-containing protein